MRQAKGNMLYMGGDAFCITTNGFVKANGECVMGKGIAKSMAMAFPQLPKLLGNAIQENGNCTQQIDFISTMRVIAFPVKHSSAISNGTNYVSHKHFPIGSTVPGWALKADLALIKRSALQLVELIDKTNCKNVLLPRPGCGAGELDWKDVEPILCSILDDRFIICTF